LEYRKVRGAIMAKRIIRETNNRVLTLFLMTTLYIEIEVLKSFLLKIISLVADG